MLENGAVCAFFFTYKKKQTAGRSMNKSRKVRTITIIQAGALALLAIFGAFAAQGHPQPVQPSCSSLDMSTPCDL